MQNYMDLSGKVALITGASSGIGAAAVEVFANLGANVAIAYNQNTRGAEQVALRAKKTGANPVAIQADMGQVREIHWLAKEAAARLGPIDVWEAIEGLTL